MNNCYCCEISFSKLANLKSHYTSNRHINKALETYNKLTDNINKQKDDLNKQKDDLNKQKDDLDKQNNYIIEIKKDHNNELILLKQEIEKTNRINVQTTQENLLLKTKNINNERLLNEKTNKIKVNNLTISRLNSKINELTKKLDDENNKKDNLLKEHTEILKDQTNILKKIVEKDTIQDSNMSALTYANKYYINTPALLRISNYQINDYDLTNPEEKEKLLNTIMNYHDNKTLHRLLGEHIIKYYKKTNPEEQSFHSTDCSRLTYIVRDIVENAGKWIQDRNGLLVSDKIIKPIVERCVEMLIELQTKLTEELAADLNKIDRRIYNILEIISSIDKGEMVLEINKYIAPYFSMQKLIK